MKTNGIYPIILLASLLFTACKKESIPDSLVGEWQVRERYNGYFNGGDFQWSTVPTAYRYNLVFTADGNYSEQPPTGNTPNFCKGTYLLQSDKKVEVTSSCFLSSYSYWVDISRNTLIITHQVREGEIKEKFVRVK